MKTASRVFALTLAVALLLGLFAAPGEACAAKPRQVRLPVLSIETERRGEGATDFITEPVAALVSEAKASWTPGYVIPPAPYYEPCTVSVTGAEGEALLDPCEAQVKVRGNWTTLYPKKPLRIKFAEKRNLLGLNDGAEQKNWLLLAEYKDASMLRNKAALSLSREILGPDGLYAADAAFVQVEVNGEYQGLYLLTEMQQVGAHRVNVTACGKDYTGTDIGYLLEYDGYFEKEDELHRFPLDLAGNAALRYYTGDPNSTYTMKIKPRWSFDPQKPVGIAIKSTVNSREQHDFIENFVNKVYRIMYEAAYNGKAFVFDAAYRDIRETSELTPQQAVERVVDVRSLADMYIISELTCDADIYWSSFYMDADFGPEGDRKLRFEAPWDFDSSMGNKDRCLDGTGFYAANVVPDVDGGRSGGGRYDTLNPWLVVLVWQDWYQALVRESWTRAYDGGVFRRCGEMIASDSASLQDEFDRNYAKWNNITRNRSDFVAELSEPAKACRTEAEAAAFLLRWFNSRVAFLNSQWHT